MEHSPQLPPQTIYDLRRNLAVIHRNPEALRKGAPVAELAPAFRKLINEYRP